jgi:acyl-coenzyme A thioesterase PaaI-like protein
LIESRQYVLTAEYKINFLVPAKAPQLKAVGEVARAGRTLTVSQVHLYGVDATGEEALCALATVTLATLQREAPSSND